MPRTFAFIPCTKSKAERSCSARDMYWPSAGFRGAWQVAHQWGCQQLLIFSAKHGVLLPDEVIEPYDATLIGAGRLARERWAATVILQLGLAGEAPLIKAGDLVLSFLPRDYGEILHRVLRESGVEVDEPLQGKRPGERLAWFKQQLQQVPGQ